MVTHAFDNWMQSIGVDRCIDVPVAEPRSIVAPVAKPAIIKDETLSPDAGSSIDQVA